MRKSVITGVFACALVFAVSGGESEAATIQNIKIDNSGVVLALSNEVEDHSLVSYSEAESNKENSEKKEKVETVYTIKKGDTLSKIAKEYDITWPRIFYKNEYIENPDIISEGEKLIIPREDEQLKERTIPQPVVAEPEVKEPTAQALISTNEQSASNRNSSQVASPATATPKTRSAPVQVSRGSSSGNLYTAGYCTWYVKNKRPDLPNNLGNAITWASRAAAQGMATGTTPRTGAVGQRGNHVVYVESVNSDGTVTISEMNHKGLYVRTVRTLPASYFTYIY